MTTPSPEKDAPGHHFPPTSNPGIYYCSFCGLVTNRRVNEPCPSRPLPPASDQGGESRG